MQGKTVKSLRGHDKGNFYVVLRQDGNMLYVADGKSKKLDAPKKKNIKHVIFTDEKQVNLSDCTDKSLKKLVNSLKKCSEKEEFPWQKKI